MVVVFVDFWPFYRHPCLIFVVSRLFLFLRGCRGVMMFSAFLNKQAIDWYRGALGSVAGQAISSPAYRASRSVLFSGILFFVPSYLVVIVLCIITALYDFLRDLF